MSNIPKTYKAVILGKAEGRFRIMGHASTLLCDDADQPAFPTKYFAGKAGEVWHPLTVEEKEIPQLQDGQVLVKLNAAALNYREIWIRRCGWRELSAP